MNRRASILRAALERRKALVVPGCHDALSARIVESAGFEAVQISGFGLAGSLLGKPDVGLVDMNDILDIRMAPSPTAANSLCPLHQETRPSFYVNPQKNLFYCHGCGRGGDLIRFVQLFLDLPFRQSVAYLEQELMPAPASELLAQTVAFYQMQLHRHPEAIRYLQHRGLHDPTIIEELGIGYAPGGNLRGHLTGLGHPFHLLLDTGLISDQGRDAFCRRVIFPCCQHGQVVNLYGRSIGGAFPHRLLPRSKGGLFAWDSVSYFSIVILVEGLFDLATLWAFTSE